MSASQFPPPPIPHIDGRKLGKPPRSMLIACAIQDFGMSRAEAEEMVDRVVDGAGLEVDADR